jgi:hypothetical protein
VSRSPYEERSLWGQVPESWCCIDCGFNTAPGCFNRAQLECASRIQESVEQTIDSDSEIYTVRDTVWKKANMAAWGGCLCIGCLEKRIGRRLKPKDFDRDHPFNQMPGTTRLLSRRK